MSTTTALDVINRLPFELAERLESDPYFADIVIVVAEEGNIAAQIDQKLAALTLKGGKRGMAVVVLPLVGDDEFPNVTFSPMTLRPAFMVAELLELNRDKKGTGKSARQVARQVVTVIKSCCLLGLTTEFVPEKPCIEPADLGEKFAATYKAYQVNFYTYEADNEENEQVATPQFAAAESDTPKLSITCATADAEIWFTLDDSYPRPGNVKAAIYSGPIDIPDSGLLVRAGAYKTGCVGSQINRKNIGVNFTS
jgi:hypothetical protein